MPTQADVQSLIQSLTPSGVNNGNPNTIYNQPRQSTPAPFIGANGQWYLNTINPAATQAPQSLSYTPWMAPSNSLQQTRIQWPILAQPQTPTVPTTPVTPTPVPATPVPTAPVQPTPVTTTQPPIAPVTTNPRIPRGVGGGDERMCVCIDQDIFGFGSPESVLVGDIMPTVNPETFEMGLHEVTYSTTKEADCVQIITNVGATLKCSLTAPLLGRDGTPVLAGDLAMGDEIAYSENGMFDYAIVVESIDIGKQLVRHITCGDQYFLAGNGNGKYILHHNVKMIPGTGMNLFALHDQLSQMQSFGGDGYDGPNTRGAMQEAGVWDRAHGGTMSDPATQWGQNMMDSGQGPWAGSGGGNAGWDGSLYQAPTGSAATPISNAPTQNPLAAPANNLPAYSNDWMSSGMPSGVGSYDDVLQSWNSLPYSFANNGAVPAAPQGSGVLAWLKKAGLTVADAILPGNLYDSKTGAVAPTGAWLTSVFDQAAGTGGLISKIAGYGSSEGLKDGYNADSSKERYALGLMQNSYSQGSPEVRAQAVAEMRQAGYPQSVIDIVTGGQSVWMQTR